MTIDMVSNEMNKDNSPLTLVIFGASGDLARRKLMPALLRLHKQKMLPTNVQIACVARGEYSDKGYCDYIYENLSEELRADRAAWDSFAGRVNYYSGSVDDAEDMRALEANLAKNVSSNRVYYMALTPSVMARAVSNLGKVGMFEQKGCFRRVVLEKPFGTDLNSARELAGILHNYLEESQVYRIDHYLGKDTVQNLLVFRFANSIFEPLWNRNYIEHIQISVLESIGLEGRAEFYDQTGVLKDMFQSHILQLLALVTMEPPIATTPDALRDEKSKLLTAVQRYSVEAAARNSVRGQYDGYRQEAPQLGASSTATFGALRLYIDNWRWQGVPIFLRSGKNLKHKETNIVITFREPPHTIFEEPDGDGQFVPNALIISIQPDEGVDLCVQNKMPGERMRTMPQTLRFRFPVEELGSDAYQRLLLDAMQGDHSLFIRSDEVECSWDIIDPFVEAWRTSLTSQLFPYQPGSWGPSAAEEFIGDGRHWTLRAPLDTD